MQTLWLSPTDYVSGDSSLRIAHPSVSNPNTTVTSKTRGDLKWISMDLHLPPHARVEEVIVCCQVSNARSFISQVRLAEMNTPDRAVVIHDDGTDLQSIAPVCYSSNVGGKVPTPGTAVTLALRLNFQNTSDRIMLGAVGIRIVPLAECSLNVRDFGAKGDTRKVSDGEITAGATELTSATAGFTPSDVGKRIGIAGAGASSLFTREEGGTYAILFSERVDEVTVEAIAIDMNGAQSDAYQFYLYQRDVLRLDNPVYHFVNSIAFRTNDPSMLSKNLRIRDTRVFDGTGQNICCGHGILVLEYQNVWIERNHLSEGLRIKAGGVGDKLVIENNIVEDGNLLFGPVVTRHSCRNQKHCKF